MECFTSANNELMEGNNYDGTGDIRSYFADGAFVGFGGVDKNNVTDAMNSFLFGQSMNQLWRTQKIFVMGGGACGDGQGIGSGLVNYSVCLNNIAWYLYWRFVYPRAGRTRSCGSTLTDAETRQEDNVISVISHQWGWVTAPPGAASLGT